MSELWCLHVLGPDDIIAAPSKEAAEVAKWFLTRYWGQQGPDDPPIGFEVEPWPFTPESHAKDVQMFYVETGTFEGMTIEQSASPQPGDDK